MIKLSLFALSFVSILMVGCTTVNIEGEGISVESSVDFEASVVGSSYHQNEEDSEDEEHQVPDLVSPLPLQP